MNTSPQADGGNEGAEAPIGAMARAAVMAGVGERLEIVERPVPAPGPGQALLQVLACGVCHSDVNLFRGGFGFARFPTVPGHEIVATVIAHGDGVQWPAIGTRVGLPFLHSSCGHCEMCVRGNEILCRDKDITGVTVEGGYQEYMLAKAAFLTPIPDGLEPLYTASWMCAGLTAYNGLRRAGLGFGDRVTVIGSGGLGHMTIQTAHAMGARVMAIVQTREDLADVPEGTAELVYVHDEVDDLGGVLREWDGGPSLIANTAPVTEVANRALTGIAPDGTLLVLGYDPKQPVEADPLAMILGRTRVMGSPSGSPQDLRDALNFAAANGIRPTVNAIGLDQAPDAIETMHRGEMHGRTVIDFTAEA